MALRVSRDFNFSIGTKHASYRFALQRRVLMQDVGWKKDTKFKQRKLSLSPRELPVGSIRHLSVRWRRNVFSREALDVVSGQLCE